MPDWLLIVLQTVILFGFFVLIIPILGRKPLSTMTLFDSIHILVIGSMTALIAFRIIPNFWHGFVALLIWIVAFIGVQYLIQKSKLAHDHLYGKEIVVMKEGKVLEENLQSVRMTGEELLSQLRRRNIFHLADVEFAVMETNGEISALVKRERQHLTPKDMSIQVDTEKEPQTVLLDGNVLNEPLATMGLNKAWLMNELDKKGLSAENVFIAQVDSTGELYIDLFDDSIQLPQPTTKTLLLSTLKKAEADLIKFSLETQNEEWKQTYTSHSQTLRQTTKNLEPHLRQ